MTSPGRESAKVVLAPGARIVVRTKEWLVRRVDPSADGGYLLTWDGLFERLRGMSALFLAELKGSVEMLGRHEVHKPARAKQHFTAGVSSSHRRRTLGRSMPPCSSMGRREASIGISTVC